MTDCKLAKAYRTPNGATYKHPLWLPVGWPWVSSPAASPLPPIVTARRFFRVEFSYRSAFSGRTVTGAIVGPADSPRHAVTEAERKGAKYGYRSFTVTEVWENFTDLRESVRLR